MRTSRPIPYRTPSVAGRPGRLRASLAPPTTTLAPDPPPLQFPWRGAAELLPSNSTMEARWLRAIYVNGSSDPYVRLQLGMRRAKTTVVKRSLSPIWCACTCSLVRGTPSSSPARVARMSVAARCGAARRQVGSRPTRPDGRRCEPRRAVVRRPRAATRASPRRKGRLSSVVCAGAGESGRCCSPANPATSMPPFRRSTTSHQKSIHCFRA